MTRLPIWISRVLTHQPDHTRDCATDYIHVEHTLADTGESVNERMFKVGQLLTKIGLWKTADPSSNCYGDTYT